MSLYQITSEMQGILEAVLDHGIDSPEAQAALDEHLTGLDVALDTKAERYCGFIRELEMRADARSKEASRIRALAAADDALATRLKEGLKAAMETTGRLKMELPSFKLSIAASGGKQSLQIDDDAVKGLEVPLVKIVTEPNKEAIRIVLEAGGEIPGCRLLPRGTSLRIR
jgi:hypothetical protein